VEAAENAKLLDGTAKVSVLVDNQQLCNCCDVFSGVISMLAAYFVFDICFPASLQSTMLFIESRVLGTANHNVSAAVQRRINILLN